VSWNIYFHEDLATVWALEKLDIFHNSKFHKEVHSNFLGFYQDLQQGILANYTFLVPMLEDTNGEVANSQHPGDGCGTIEEGEELMKEVYNNLFVKSQFANDTLLLITYDEHGGFWDSISPPFIPAEHRDPYEPEEWTTHHSNPKFLFDRLGVRVPAILISPWLGANVDDRIYEHSSVPKTIIDYFNLGDYLTNRVKFANNFLDHLVFLKEPRKDMKSILDNNCNDIKQDL